MFLPAIQRKMNKKATQIFITKKIKISHNFEYGWADTGPNSDQAHPAHDMPSRK